MMFSRLFFLFLLLTSVTRLEAQSLNDVMGRCQQLMQQQKFSEAYVLVKEFADKHSNTLQPHENMYTLAALSSIELQSARYAEAEAYMRDAIKISKSKLGDTLSNNYMGMKWQLGSILTYRENFREAEKELVGALTMMLKFTLPTDYNLYPYYLAVANVYAQAQQYSKAKIYFDKCSSLTFLSTDMKVGLAVNRGRMLEYTEGYEAEEKGLLEALELLRKDNRLIDSDIGYLNVMYSLANMYSMWGKSDVSMSYAAKLLSSAKAQNNKDYELWSLVISAGNFEQRGQYTKSDSVLMEIDTLISSVFGKVSTRYVQHVMYKANYFYRRGQPDRSITLLQEADSLQKSTNLKNPSSAGQINYLLSTISILKGNLPQSEQYLLQNAALFKQLLPNTLSSISCAYELGHYYKLVGDYQKAEKYYSEGINVAAANYGRNSLTYATGLNDLSALYSYVLYSQKDNPLYLKANDTLLNRSLKIYNHHYKDNTDSYMQTLLNMGMSSTASGNLKMADSLLHFVNKKYATIKNPPYYYTLSFIALGMLYHKQNNFTSARDNYIMGIGKLDSSWTEYAHSLNKLKRLYYENGYPHKGDSIALIVMKYYHQQASKDFLYLPQYNKKAFYRSFKFRFDELYSDIFFRNPGHELRQRGFETSLGTKNMMLNNDYRLRNTVFSLNDKEVTTLYNSWKEQKEFLARLKISGSNDAARLTRADSTVQRNETELIVALKKHQINYQQQKADWHSVQSSLEANDAAIEIVRFRKYNKEWSDSSFYGAFVITPETKTEPHLVVLGTAAVLEGKAFDAYRQSRNVPDSLAYSNYWRPLLPFLKKAKRIFISGDGIYRKLNLNILYNGSSNTFLLDEAELIYVNSCGEIPGLKKSLHSHIPAENTTALLVGFPSYKLTDNSTSKKQTEQAMIASFPELPGTLNQVNSLNSILKKKQWRTKLLTKDLASETNLKKFPNPGILHIATHARYIEPKVDQRNVTDRGLETVNHTTDPLFNSYLYLAGVENNLAGNPNITDDGQLTAYEGMNLDLSKTDLVTLSACETGLGEIRDGEGVYGFQYAFMAAGAKSLIMSLWPVNDEATEMLFNEFYKQWLDENRSKREAFLIAQRKVKENYPEPFYWGGFIFIGS
jgi:CHAT domain-containing protein